MAAGITKTTVVSCNDTRYQQKIQAGPHIITADEPRSLGGDGTGATPISLLLGALGSCTSITLKMYAERKSLPLTGIETYLSHERRGDRDHIDREITIYGPDLTPDQRKRMMEIADMCPVHRMLSGSADISTRERQSD